MRRSLNKNGAIMRKSIFDLMSNKEIDIEREFIRIRKLFEKEHFYGIYSIKTYIDDYYFQKWKRRGRFLSLNDLFTSLGIKDSKGLKDNTLEYLLMYIEVIVNMLKLGEISNINSNTYRYEDFNMEIYVLLKENIETLLEDLNYEIKVKNNQEYIIVEKDILLSAVAESNEDICNDIIEYRRFSLKGNILEKRNLLKLLANKVEGMKNLFKGTTYNNMFEDIQFMLNNFNIRHNNVQGKNRKEYIVNLNDEELEQLYDKTFDMILGLFVINDYLNEKENLKELKNSIK